VEGQKADLLPRALETTQPGGRQWRAIPLLRLLELGGHTLVDTDTFLTTLYKLRVTLSGCTCDPPCHRSREARIMIRLTVNATERLLLPQTMTTTGNRR
jgi:hypothetical protein